MPFPDGTPTLIEEGEALCARLNRRRGHSTACALVERVKDLEFQHDALGFLQGVDKELSYNILRKEAYAWSLDADIKRMLAYRDTLIHDIRRLSPCGEATV